MIVCFCVCIKHEKPTLSVVNLCAFNRSKAGVCELYDVRISEGFAMVISCVIAMMSCLHLCEECYKNPICLGLESFSNLGKGQDSNSRDLI